ncbi:hypothetical protein HYT00_01050 [Candidatus Giovannonibacteria bacterium]|nr:hypothetical protein [Candidatus Giovannonibacteria bacterium]
MKKTAVFLFVLVWVLTSCVENNTLKGRAKRLAQTGEWVVTRIERRTDSLVVIFETGNQREVVIAEPGLPHFEDYLRLKAGDKIIFTFDPGGKDNYLQAFLWPAKKDRFF